MEEIDEQLVQHLREDPRARIGTLADKLHVDRRTVASHLKHLLSTGKVKLVVIVPEEERPDQDISFMSVQLEHNDPKTRNRLNRKIMKMPEILECYMLNGDSDYLMKVRTDDSDGLDRIAAQLPIQEQAFKTSTLVVRRQVK